MTAPVWPDAPRYLLSYAYADKMTDFGAYAGADVVIDSGAFTAYNSGKAIDLDRYIDWLRGHRKAIRFGFALDVIGDHAASARNYDRMREALGTAVQVVPTWHIGSPWPELERLCREADYVSIGGAVPFFRQQTMLMRHLIRAHKVAREHGTSLHGLGLTGQDVMNRLPWASVDSSSWTMPRRMPLVYLARRDGSLATAWGGQNFDPVNVPTIRAYGGDPIAMRQDGYSLVSVAGKEVANARTAWAVTASARSYQYVEAVKRARTGHDFRIYFASLPGSLEPTAAHALGSPWPAQAAPVRPRRGTTKRPARSTR